MIRLFNVNNYVIDMSEFSGLHDGIVEEFEQKIADFVGAKYACGVSSATNAIFLSLLNKETTVTIPSVIPPVVCNAILTSGNKLEFKDDINWVGDSYIFHEFEDYKIIDSAQKITKNQFKLECNPEDLMIFSFYPTKPVGSYDGGMVVSDDKEKIEWFKLMVKNGTKFNTKSWEREIVAPGYKMYLNAIQAHIANENFKKLKEKYDSLGRIRDIYNSEFKIENTSNHLYRVNVGDRFSMLEDAKNLDIELGIHYKCLHSGSIYSTKPKEDFIKSEFDSDTTVSIPFHEKLTSEDVEKVIKLVKKYNDF
jgi:dTDP-4-amino-4,6-dideoxygalactose transaminase